MNVARYPAILVWVFIVSVAGATVEKSIFVPEQSASLVIPILDLRFQSLRECGEVGQPSRCTSEASSRAENERERRVSDLLKSVTHLETPASDEALVVLSCFYIGESQEEADAILERGRRMLPIIYKYQKRIPKIPDRNYPFSMLRTDKESNLRGLIRGIRLGWRSTTDNPEG